MKLFDAHCHFPEGCIDSMLKRANVAGVVGIAICGTSTADWDQIFQTLEKMTENIPPIGKTDGCRLRLLPNLGIHPWFVSNDWKESFQTLEKNIRNVPMLGKENPTQLVSKAGIGETGLDFQERFTNRAEQEACFAAHLDLARELDRPVTVHCVQAWGRLLDILREHPAPKVMLHAYSGSAELISELIKLSGWFSFGEAVMNPKAKRARAAVVAVPAERLLIETDSDGEPEKLIDIARAVAELRGVPVEKIAELTFGNAQKLFA